MFDVLLGASGGLLGIVGALFKHGIEVWQDKKKADASLAMLIEQNKHELAMVEKQTESMKVEAQNGLALANIVRAQEIDTSMYSALEASYAADKASYSDAANSPWMIAVDAVRGFIRPALTLVFSAALIVMTAWLWVHVPDSITQGEEFLSATFYRLIDALIFLSTSTVGWWFAARQTSK